MWFLHELTYIFVFHPSLFCNFNDGKCDSQNKLNNKKIETRHAINAAKIHFGCDNLKGVEIEDSVGSHWESRIMLGDYMISSDYPENVISDIALALFEDSGWYTVNKYFGGLVRIKAVNSNRCFAGRTGKGVCYLTTSLRIPAQFQYYKDTTKGGFEFVNFCLLLTLILLDRIIIILVIKLGYLMRT